MRGAAARQVVLALHGSNGGSISGRSSHDILPLDRGSLRPLEDLPHLGDAEAAGQNGGGSSGGRRRGAAAERP